MPFQFVEPTLPLESQWRSIILFGRNVASYKFALGTALMGFADRKSEAIRLEDLALPFALQVASHLKSAPRQSTGSRSAFLDACREFNGGRITEDDLREAAVRLGFVNVIDAFHIVGGGPTREQFFVDLRRTSHKGIALTDSFFELMRGTQALNLPSELDARWRLVETAWSIGLPATLLRVDVEGDGFELTVRGDARRTSVTTARSALNGYQKGKCFYCGRVITVVPLDPDFCEVDHLLPFTLQRKARIGVDRVWNLVLACVDCNRGPKGKFARVPALVYLERLHRRNEYLIQSHHPLRETLMAQTGADESARGAFLQRQYDEARKSLAAADTWTVVPTDPTGI